MFEMFAIFDKSYCDLQFVSMILPGVGCDEKIQILTFLPLFIFFLLFDLGNFFKPLERWFRIYIFRNIRLAVMILVELVKQNWRKTSLYYVAGLLVSAFGIIYMFQDNYQFVIMGVSISIFAMLLYGFLTLAVIFTAVQLVALILYLLALPPRGVYGFVSIALSVLLIGRMIF